MDEAQVVDNGVSRRSFLATSSKALAGAALASTVLAGTAKEAAAAPYASKYEYTPLDPLLAGQIAYENYSKRFCSASVIAGLASQLAEKAGGAWKDFPIDAFRWAHGGFAGWGATCGTIVGGATIVGLVVKDTDIAEAMSNDLAFYYSYTELPAFTPRKNLIADIKNMTIASTPVCHISVGRWMQKEGEAFLSDGRAERCARLAADIAMETVRMLNDWKAGKYKPRHKPLFNVLNNGITSQNNCMDCHGQRVPAPAETYPTIDTAPGAECAPPSKK